MASNQASQTNATSTSPKPVISTFHLVLTAMFAAILAVG